VASIAAAVKGEEAPDEDGESKPDPQAAIVETLKALKESMSEMGRKPRGYKVVRDKLGEMQNIELDWGE
jgi:hypothetical protein